MFQKHFVSSEIFTDSVEQEVSIRDVSLFSIYNT